MTRRPDEAVLPAGVRQHLGLQLALFFADKLSEEAKMPFEAVLARLERALELRAAAEAHAFRRDLVALRPRLIARAVTLVRNPATAEELVQEALLRAWRSRGQYAEGTNLEAWAFTILRNLCMSHHRERQREVEDADGRYAESLVALPNQELRLTLQDVERALQGLPTKMREAFVRVAVDGMSYEDVAAQLGCRMGTVKSRVSRARARLEAMLEGWLDEKDREADATS